MIQEDIEFFEEHLEILVWNTDLGNKLNEVWQEIKRLAIYGKEAEELAKQGKAIIRLDNLPKRIPRLFFTERELDDDNDS
jgi:hypothetical protein